MNTLTGGLREDQAALAAARVADSEAKRQMEALRAEIYTGHSAVLQAVDALRGQLGAMERARQATQPQPHAASLSMATSLAAVPSAVPPPTLAPTLSPTLPPPTLPSLAPAIAQTAGKGPTWDHRQVAAVESVSEQQYWYQRNEKNSNVHPSFTKYGSNWPCLWGEEYTGVGAGDGNKWTCGARLIQSPCVIYSFGSNNNMKFEKGLHQMGLGCEIHIYDPTTNAPPEASKLGCKYHKMGLGSRDGWQGALPTKTLSSLMRENGHSHIDILKVDIEDMEHEVFRQVGSAGWPSVGQFLVEVHVRGMHADVKSLDSFFQNVERANLRLFHQETNWEFGATCCIEYAFIHKSWRPETKKYDMSTAPTYRDAPLKRLR
ncbi:unnamed protein product [Effrenium voratum]|nr:unnamed protein product [Effrenium voratum]